MIDGTPILDIKPYIPDYDCPNQVKEASGDDENELANEKDDKDTVKVPDWITNRSSSLTVLFTERALKDLKKFSRNSFEFPLEHLNSWTELKSSVSEILGADPRSVYRRDKCGDKLYYLSVDLAHFTVWFDEDNVAEVLKVKPLKSGENPEDLNKDS